MTAVERVVFAIDSTSCSTCWAHTEAIRSTTKVLSFIRRAAPSCLVSVRSNIDIGSIVPPGAKNARDFQEVSTWTCTHVLLALQACAADVRLSSPSVTNKLPLRRERVSFDGETGGRSRDTHGLWVTLGTLSTELADEAVLGGCLVIVCADLSFIDAVSGESEATRKLDDAVASIRRLGGAVLLLDTAPARNLEDSGVPSLPRPTFIASRVPTISAARLNEAASHLSVHHLLRHAIRCAWAGLALIPKPKEQLQIAVHLPVEAGSALLGRISVPAPILAQSLPRSLDLTGRVPASTLRGTALSSKLDHASAALCLCIPEPDTPEGGGARAEGEPAGKEEPSLDALVRMLAARAQAALLRSRSGDLFALEPLSATHATAQLTPLCASAWEDLTRGPCGPRGRFDPCEPSPSAGLARSRGSRRASRATDSQGATGLSAMEKRILLDARDRPAGRGVAAQWGRGWVLTPTGAAMRQRMRCLDVLSAAPGGGPSAGTPHGHGVSGRGGVSAPWEGLEGEADAQTPPLPMRGGATPVTEGVAGEEADGAGTVCVHGACAGEMAARVSKEREDLRIARGRRKMDAAVDDLEEEASRHRTAVGARKGQAGVPRCSEAALTLLALASTACRGGGGLTSLVRAYLDRIAGRPSHQGGSESTVGAFLAPGAAVQATVALKTCPELFGVPNEALLVGYEAVAVACLEAGAWAADQGCTRGKAGKQVEKAVRTALKPVLEKLQMLLSRGRGVGSVRGDFGEALERICGPYRGKMGKLVGKLERELLGDQGGSPVALRALGTRGMEAQQAMDKEGCGECDAEAGPQGGGQGGPGLDDDECHSGSGTGAVCGDGQRPGAPRAVAAQLHKRHVLRSRRTVRTHRAPAAPPAPASAPQDHAAGPAKDVRVGFRNASKKGGAAGAHGAGKREAAPADGAKRDAKSPVVVRRHVVVHETPGPVRERVCTRGGGAGLHRPPQQRGIAAIDSDDESGDAAGGAVIVPETCQKPRRSGLGAGGAVVVGCTPPSGGERDSRGVASGREKSSAGRFAVRKQLVFSPVGKRRQRSSSGHGVCEGVAESVSDSFEEVGAPSAPLGVGSIGAGDSLLPLGAGDMPRSAVKSPSPSPSPWRSPAGGEEHGAGGGSEGEAVERGEQAGKGAATWTEKEEEASEELIVVLSEESGRSGENGRARGEEASSREKGVEEVKETERPARKGKGTESGGGRAGGKGKGRGAGKALGVRKGAAASKQGKGGSNTRGRAALGKIEGASAAPGTSVGGGRWSLRASTVLDGKATRSAAIAEGRLKQGQEGVAAGVAQEGGRRDEKRGAGGGERGVKRGREGDDRRGQLEGGKVDLAKDGAERKREGERAPGAAARKKRAAHGDMPVAESGNADVVQPRAKRASTAMSTMATMALARQAASVCEPAGGRERQGKVAQGQGRKVLGRTAQAKARRQGVVNGKVDL